MISSAKTDIGMKRSNNEDSIFASDITIGKLPNLYIVADGMGGHNGGEIASSKAVAAFTEFAETAEGEITDILAEGVRYANNTVYNIGAENPELSKMGTTIDAVCIDCNSEKVYIAHVGDSRVYIINKETIRVLTCDHSYVMDLVRAGIINMQQAETHPDKNIITKAVGIDNSIECDVVIDRITPEDYILLCSDGLSNMLSESEIYDIIINNDFSIENKVNMLIDRANQNGGNDNISAVLLKR